MYSNTSFRNLLERAASTDKHILVVLDGLDEALQGSFDPSIIPTRLPPTIRVVASARWQVGWRIEQCGGKATRGLRRLAISLCSPLFPE
jgi:hypothetical protein